MKFEGSSKSDVSSRSVGLICLLLIPFAAPLLICHTDLVEEVCVGGGGGGGEDEARKQHSSPSS